MQRLDCMKRDLETERSMKAYAIRNTQNPVEQELLERELSLIDAQISWLCENVVQN